MARSDEVDTLVEVEAAAGEMFRDVGLDAIADDDEPAAEDLLTAIAAQTIWVAEVGGRVVGYAWTLDLGRPGRPLPHLEQLSVRPEHGGRGIGTVLVEEAMRWARRQGGTDLTLTTFRDVWFNRPWYERRGFEVLSDDHLIRDEARLNVGGAARRESHHETRRRKQRRNLRRDRRRSGTADFRGDRRITRHLDGRPEHRRRRRNPHSAR